LERKRGISAEDVNCEELARIAFGHPDGTKVNEISLKVLKSAFPFIERILSFEESDVVVWALMVVQGLPDDLKGLGGEATIRELYDKHCGGGERSIQKSG
jgi:hypothetical protein